MKKLVIFLFSFFLVAVSYAQLPAGYKYFRGESAAGRDDYYTNGRIFIYHDVVQEFGDGGAAEWIKYVYEGFMVIKTKDGLVVGIGSANDTYMYMVFEGQVYYLVTSKSNTNEFSDMSKYVLRKVREMGTHFLER